MVPLASGGHLAKLLDFGIVQLRESPGVPKLTVQGMLLGTPAFMAPEQVRMEPTDPRTDVYAMGATMYEALSGRLPHEGDTPMRIVHAVLAGPPPDLSEVSPETSIELAAVVRKAMARDPWGRYPNAAAMRDALISLRPAVGTQRRLTAVERPRTSETPTMGAVPSARGVAIPAQPALALEDIDRVLPPTRGPGARWSGAIGVVLVAVVISVAAWAATRSAVPVASLARDLQPARAVGPAVAPSAISTETPGTRLPPRAAVPAIEGVLPAGVDPPLSAEPTSVPRPARGALLRHTQLEPVVGGPVEQRSVEQDPVAPDEDGQNDDGREPGILNPFD